MTRSTRILGGVLALVVAAILFMAGEFFLSRSDLLMNPSADPEAFGEMVTGSGFAFYAGRGLVGCFLEAVSMVALYFLLQDPRTEPWAFWGMFVSLLGDLAGAVFFGNLFFVYPDVGELLLEGQPDVLGVVEPSMALLAIMFLAAVIGFGLFGVALWIFVRARRTRDRWAS